MKLDYDITFYIEGYEIELEDIEKIINERNTLHKEKDEFIRFIHENEVLINQINLIKEIKLSKETAQLFDFYNIDTLAQKFYDNFIEYFDKIKDSL